MNKSINIKEEILKSWKSEIRDKGVDEPMSKFYDKIENFLSNSLDRMREETARDCIENIDNIGLFGTSEVDLFYQDPESSKFTKKKVQVVRRETVEAFSKSLKNKYRIQESEEKPKA